jgi:hypothetical protein
MHHYRITPMTLYHGASRRSLALYLCVEFREWCVGGVHDCEGYLCS